MADKSLLNTPADNLEAGNPNDRKGGPGKYDGVPGLPARTSSKNALPEKTYDEFSGVDKGRG